MSVSAIKGVSDLVKLCVQHGVEQVVVSPGSRNAPLSITFDHTNGIRTCVIPDERSAAFFALGMALATRKPVAVVCTSGSAAYNYAPAVSEAYYQKVPLIVITADRPQAWINQGDGQTIMQENIYGQHILFSANLPLVQDEETAWLYNRLVNQALIKANGNLKGPVHLNVPFREPLYQQKEDDNTQPRLVKHYGVAQAPVRVLMDEVAAVMANAKKVLFLAGQLSDGAEVKAIADLLHQHENVVVLSETTSNLSGEKMLTTIDRLVDGFTAEEKKNMAPDVLVTFGDAVVSKKVKAWLRSVKPTAHIHIGFEHNLVDTYQCLSHWIEAPNLDVLAQLLPIVKFAPEYFNHWHQRKLTMIKKHQAFVAQVPWSDFKVFDFVLQQLPACHLHLGNSTPIRYAQLFEKRSDMMYFSNRGTSGIDGCSSTAAGMAYINQQLQVLITGDVSFYYDSNAWWNNYLGGNLKIVLINNKGGNIFRFIDGPDDEKLTQQYFEAKQEMKAEYLCKQFNIGYFSATSQKELEQAFDQMMAPSDRPALIEIFTDNIVSPQILKDYFNFLKV